MARINLLPWRVQLRRERRQRFLMGLALTAVAAIGVVFWANRMLAGSIADQNARNQYLTREIAVLDSKLETIKALKRTRDALLARMRVIEQLEASRPTTVHLFDQLVRTLPDKLYLTRIQDKGGKLSINGVAESPAVVSAYMQNIAQSPWLQPPNLEVVRTQTSGSARGSNFSVTTAVKEPGTAATPAAAGEARR